MAAEANRLAQFRRLVESLSPAGRGGKPKLSEGYRIVAAEADLTYDYVYQVYTGKSNKTGLGAEAVRKISDAFGEGKPADWMDRPIEHEDMGDEFEPIRPPTLPEAWASLAAVLAAMDDIGREIAAGVLASLAKNPEKADASLQVLQTLVRVHALPPKDPAPTTPPGSPSPKRGTTAAARNPKKAVLVLKIGGGQKQQFDLPLSRKAFSKDSASPNERRWYEQLRSAPKADSEELDK